MDFAWSEEQTQFRESVKKFALEELNDGLRERDKRSEFNLEGWRKCADFGIHGLPIPIEHGGLGADPLTTVGVLESLGYGCKDNGLVFSINAHMWTLEVPLLDFGSKEQKQRYLPRLCNGSLVGGNAMTEPGSGSDAYSLQTTAERRGDRYVLNGSKTFVSNGGVGDLIIVYATLDRSIGPNGICGFLVERDYPGLQVGRALEKMGLRTSPMAEVFLENCEVPVENRLGREGNGKNLFTHSMNWERACILASAVGAMQRLLETSIRYAKDRKQFGQSIGKFQLVATKLVDMKMRVDQARAALYQTAWLQGKGKSIFLEAALAKLTISENWVRCAEDAIQIRGGYGYMVESEVERELRDALGSRLYSGTSEIQRVLIASLLGL
ncbi:acyl-CoA dehydrogenase family protein [Microvirga brassicacearum]|uniref:Acyl-CoA dehydrogenase n=1 Tax=Microvirga brassicacearum TaxID=2580413 RepID=A0A5N3PJ65_9HYPH|nr:acyl-CoA dehydrogenase family protein [Microvirga brassicacearum]KAB0269764.1 acyl-CoA dehydrogenase [Microvirga brassicacearum]